MIENVFCLYGKRENESQKVDEDGLEVASG